MDKWARMGAQYAGNLQKSMQSVVDSYRARMASDILDRVFGSETDRLSEQAKDAIAIYRANKGLLAGDWSALFRPPSKLDHPMLRDRWRREYLGDFNDDRADSMAYAFGGRGAGKSHAMARRETSFGDAPRRHQVFAESPLKNDLPHITTQMRYIYDIPLGKKGDEIISAALRNKVKKFINKREEELINMAMNQGEKATIAGMEASLKSMEARIASLKQERDDANGALTRSVQMVEAKEKALATQQQDNMALRADLQRALGYIDRVNEDSEPVAAVELPRQYEQRRRGPYLLGVGLNSASMFANQCDGSENFGRNRRY